MIMYNHQICAEALYETGVSESDVNKAIELFDENEQLGELLSSPVFSKGEKYALVKKVFPENLHNFLCVMIDTGNISDISEIFEAYKEIILGKSNIIKAKLSYVNKPDVETQESFKNMLKKKYSAADVILELSEDRSLIGGYKLQIGDTVFDKSISGSLKAFRNKLVRGANA